MMDADADLRVVEFGLRLSVHLVRQVADARGSNGARPLEVNRSRGVAAAAAHAERVLALVHLDLEDLRQNRVPAEGPNRDVNTTRDLDIAPANEPKIGPVERSRQLPSAEDTPCRFIAGDHSNGSETLSDELEQPQCVRSSLEPRIGCGAHELDRRLLVSKRRSPRVG